MPRPLKIFIIIVFVLISLFGGLLIYVYQNVDQLKQYALKEVNKQLKSELKAESIDVTVFESFPNVSLVFNKISMSDPLRPKQQLLQANQLFLGFDIYDVLNKNYKIHELVLDSASVNLYTDVAGRNNYDILKESKNETNKNKPFSFELNKLNLKQVVLTIENRKSDFKFSGYLDRAELSGKFSETHFELVASLKGFSDMLQISEFSFLKEKDIHAHVTLNVNQETNKYELLKGEFGINKLILNLNGWVQNQKKQTEYQLGFKGNKISIQDLFSILPFKIPESILAYQSNGNVLFEGSVKGIQSATKNPRIKIEFGIENGNLIDPESKIKLDKIVLNGNFDNGTGGTLKESVIQIPGFSAILPGSKINGSIVLRNLEAPKLDLELTGQADFKSLHEFFKFEDVKEIAGNANFTVNLRGEKSGQNWDWTSPMNKGIIAIKVDKLKLNYLKKEFVNLVIKSEINNNSLRIEQADFNITQSDFKIKADFPNFMDFLFQKNVALKGNILLLSANLNVADILIYDSSDPRESNEKPVDYRLSVNVNAKQFTYDNFNANDFKADLFLSPDLIEFDNTSMKTCKGNISGKGEFSLLNKQYRLQCTNEAKDINMNEIFKTFNNFGQEKITSKNIYGVLNANTEMRIMWDDKLNVIPEKILVVTDLTIKNGELINFVPLNDLSRFVSVNELNNLKFSELKNTLTIKDKILHIPGMEIRNNAINISLTGTHTFENILDYNVKLSLNELLSKKRKKVPNEFDEEDVKTKGINLYLNIKGPIDNLKYTFDRKGAKADLKKDVQQEKANIKEILRQEFGIRKDTTLKKLEKKNDNNNELEFEPD